MGLYEDDGEFIDDLIAFDTANKYEKSRNSGKKNGCYIATCVYGSYDCPEVWTLRRFRDDVLWGKYSQIKRMIYGKAACTWELIYSMFIL